jgi:hypothetical protein
LRCERLRNEKSLFGWLTDKPVVSTALLRLWVLRCFEPMGQSKASHNSIRNGRCTTASDILRGLTGR